MGTCCFPEEVSKYSEKLGGAKFTPKDESIYILPHPTWCLVAAKWINPGSLTILGRKSKSFGVAP